MVGVRELNSDNLTGNQSNWINRHTVYTHGYGFVAAPANEVVSGQPIAADFERRASLPTDRRRSRSTSRGSTTAS